MVRHVYCVVAQRVPIKFAMAVTQMVATISSIALQLFQKSIATPECT